MTRGVPIRLVVVLVVVVAFLGGGLVVVPAMMMMGIAGVSQDDDTGGVSTLSCSPIAQTGNTDVVLTDTQLANAQTVIETGVSLDVPSRGLVVAVATAMQESTLQNLNHGDRDSLGLFQQRAAGGRNGSAPTRSRPPRCSTPAAGRASPA